MMISRNKTSIKYVKFVWRWLLVGKFFLCFWLPAQGFASVTAHMYSLGKQMPTQPFLNAFTKSSGIEIKTVCVSKGLAQSLQAAVTPRVNKFIDRVGW